MSRQNQRTWRYQIWEQKEKILSRSEQSIRTYGIPSGGPAYAMWESRWKEKKGRNQIWKLAKFVSVDTWLLWLHNTEDTKCHLELVFFENSAFQFSGSKMLFLWFQVAGLQETVGIYSFLCWVSSKINLNVWTKESGEKKKEPQNKFLHIWSNDFQQRGQAHWWGKDRLSNTWCWENWIWTYVRIIYKN